MRIPCEFEWCVNPRKAKGLCQGHYWQQRNGRTLAPLRPKSRPDSTRCAEEGCEGTPYGGITCKKHWEANRVARGLPKQPWDTI